MDGKTLGIILAAVGIYLYLRDKGIMDELAAEHSKKSLANRGELSQSLRDRFNPRPPDARWGPDPTGWTSSTKEWWEL